MDIIFHSETSTYNQFSSIVFLKSLHNLFIFRREIDFITIILSHYFVGFFDYLIYTWLDWMSFCTNGIIICSATLHTKHTFSICNHGFKSTDKAYQYYLQNTQSEWN